VAIVKQFFEFTPYEPARKPSAKKSKWQRVLHSIFQEACRWAIRLERVRMFPIGKRARDLKIRKVMARFVLLMFGNPSAAKWPSSKLNGDASALLNSSNSFNDFRVLSRRRELF